MRPSILLPFLPLLPLFAGLASGSPLGARGYAVLPEPQRVTLAGSDFQFSPAWTLQRKGVSTGDVAVTTYTESMRSRFAAARSRAQGAGVVTLVLAPGSVAIGEALDSDKQAIAEQAYKIDLTPKAITITANAPAGLFYGVETLLQLIKPKDGALWLPEGQIVDWPDLRLRQIYWDDAHHLDRPETLRDAIRQAAFYKINGFVIKLEGHFQFKSMPAIVEPYALSPAEFQELTDYALKHHVQLIPYVDGPAHIAFILKHPEYAGLREYPDNNYEGCAVNPDFYKMYAGMFQDIINANRGVKYFYLSTDEAYYVGLANNPQCNEAARAKELGSVGKMLAEFITKAGAWLHDHGREVVFWGEYPLKPEDIDSLPSWAINGEVYGPKYDPLFKKHGMRQTIYTYTQGEERHFPEYYPLPASERVHAAGRRARTIPRVQEIFRTISDNPARKTAELIGAVNAGWADSGLHPETFWLGYAAGTSAAWRPSPDLQEATNNFYRLFYGWNAVDMDRVYRLMSEQAQFWLDSWETGPSKARKGIWGSHNRIFNPRRPATDQYIPLPPAPNAELKYASAWSKDNARRIELAKRFMPGNDEMVGLLKQNLQKADFNRYNLEVFQSIAQVLHHNLAMLTNIARMDSLLASAQEAAGKNQAREAISAVDDALNLASDIRRERNTVLRDVTQTWYKSWYPRVSEANGRKFLHELDDVKDHVADRTVDLSYMIQREILLPFGDWVNQVSAARNAYAKAHNLPVRNVTFDWKDLSNVQ